MYYVLLEIGWQYNDEYYYTTEDNDGRPRKVFTDKEKAKQEKYDRVIKNLSPDPKFSWIRKETLEDILENYGPYTREKSMEEFKSKYDITKYFSDFTRKEQIEIIDSLENLDICFYEIVEIKE